MSFDALVCSPSRLRILAALAAEPRQAFVELRGKTGLTDGNLATHAKRLHAVGWIDIQKTKSPGQPRTTLQLTSAGRKALADHAQSLLNLLAEPADAEPVATPATPSATQDDWVD